MPDLRLVQTVAPTAEPIGVYDVYADHLRGADREAEEDYVARLVKTARRQGEWFTRRSWMPQTWAGKCDRFPYACEDDGAIALPKGPLIAVESVTYVDEDGVTQTLDDALYQVLQEGRANRPSRIVPAYNEVWPTTRVQRDAVTITYEAGYVTEGSPAAPDVPEDLVHGLLLVVGELYKQRSESVHAFNQNPALIRARDLWLPYRIY